MSLFEGKLLVRRGDLNATETMPGQNQPCEGVQGRYYASALSVHILYPGI